MSSKLSTNQKKSYIIKFCTSASKRCIHWLITKIRLSVQSFYKYTQLFQNYTKDGDKSARLLHSQAIKIVDCNTPFIRLKYQPSVGLKTVGNERHAHRLLEFLSIIEARSE